ncbi:MAG: putative GST-like protein YibF [Pseudomonas sp.]|nr:MAG: putative GST-like protein YibF [Pseudomonas sp.]
MSMILFHNPASPFVRKVRVLLLETGQQDQVTLQVALVSPISPVAELNDDNPLGKIPSLRLADGTVLHDSRVILDYLDHQHDNAPLIPRDGPARWQRLTLASVADGLMDAAVLVRYESAMRPAEKHWDLWLHEQRNKIRRTVDALEHTDLAGPFDIAAISVACGLAYLDFRHPDLNWREGHPRLSAWYADVSQRPSMLATQPPAV